jgi:uncharacterized protein YbjT (DUF2867 family)
MSGARETGFGLKEFRVNQSKQQRTSVWMNMMTNQIFITGGSGYIGRRLIPELMRHGYQIVALVRSGSEGKLPAGCLPVFGNALDRSSFASRVPRRAAFIQLVGTPHPSPAKAREFKTVDLVSMRESVAAAIAAESSHFVYVSVAQPAPFMKAYIDVRAKGEELLGQSGLNATIMRPWYVLGPGHRWPYCLLPFYWLLERIPRTSESALRLGLVTLDQIVKTLVHSIDHPAQGIRIVTVDRIRSIAGIQGMGGNDQLPPNSASQISFRPG